MSLKDGPKPVKKEKTKAIKKDKKHIDCKQSKLHAVVQKRPEKIKSPKKPSLVFCDVTY
jgi:hypothetical protein